MLVTRGYARVIMVARNASLDMPRRLEQFHCAYSHTSAVFVYAKSWRSFEEIVKKLSSSTLFKSDLQYFRGPRKITKHKSVVKCLLGDVWRKVTAE